MTTSFLDHVVRDGKCIQSQFMKLSCGSAFNQELSASAVHNYFVFALALDWVVDVILLQVGLKCFSMRDDFRSFDELLNSEMFCFFHKCM